MVAKIFLSTSFLTTRLALRPSFSESSLTVMPSEMVMLLAGGQLRVIFGTLAGAHLLQLVFAFAVAVALNNASARLALRPASVRGRRRWRFETSSGRRRVHRTAAQAGTNRAERCAGSAHLRLAGTNRAAIDRLAGNRGSRPGRHAGAGSGRGAWPGTGRVC